MFDKQPTLTARPFTLRPLTGADKASLRDAASDPLIWAGHPASDRYQRQVFDPYFDQLMAFKSTLVFLDNTTVIGCSAYYTASTQPGTIAIGYTFLTRAYWGGETNAVMKTLMLDHAFASFDCVWLHVAPTNIRSQKATQKLGAIYTHSDTMDTTSGPTEMQYFRIERSVWRDRIGH